MSLCQVKTWNQIRESQTDRQRSLNCIVIQSTARLLLLRRNGYMCGNLCFCVDTHSDLHFFPLIIMEMALCMCMCLCARVCVCVCLAIYSDLCACACVRVYLRVRVCVCSNASRRSERRAGRAARKEEGGNSHQSVLH